MLYPAQPHCERWNLTKQDYGWRSTHNQVCSRAALHNTGLFLGAFANCEKRLLALSCLSVLPTGRSSAWNNSAPPDGQLSEKVRGTSGVPQESVLGTIIFLAYVYNFWRNSESNLRQFAGDCIVYKKITDSSDIGKLETDRNRLGE